jgi:hypothetical protein
MRKWLFLVLSLALAHLQGDSIQTLASGNEYLVEMQIEQMVDQHLELIASPKLVCAAGQEAQVTMGSEDSALLAIKVTVIPKDDDEYFLNMVVEKNLNHTLVPIAFFKLVCAARKPIELPVGTDFMFIKVVVSQSDAK